MSNYTLSPKKYFEKKFLKITKNNKILKNKIIITLEKLSNNSNQPSLKSHKVKSKNFGIKWTSRVDKNIRIIWDYNEEKINVIDIFDLGGHSGSKKIYK